MQVCTLMPFFKYLQNCAFLFFIVCYWILLIKRRILSKFINNFLPLVVSLLVVFPAKPGGLEVVFFSGLCFLLRPKNVEIRFSAGLFPAMSKQEGSNFQCLPICLKPI